MTKKIPKKSTPKPARYDVLPEMRKQLYLIGVRSGKVAKKDQLPSDKVDEFFGVKKRAQRSWITRLSSGVSYLRRKSGLPAMPASLSPYWQRTIEVIKIHENGR